ncbi:hypothetical protein F4805DRAFT_459582 [Annulohypoxylon moriforme]|nr:hypothetical protein F4805DRAFT_459582 [Annulohypoxylon moriforme]
MEGLLGGITSLRNTVCHFAGGYRGYSLCNYDDKFEAVQRLATVFGNERAAFQARAIRDSLAAHASESLTEVEALWLLSQSPSPYPWRKHHILRFHDYSLNSCYDSEPGGDKGVVGRAGWDWYIHRSMTCRGDWDPYDW